VTAKLLVKRTGGKTARIDITPEGIKVCRELAANGQDARSIARRLGVGYQTYRTMAERDEVLREAVAEGHALLSDELTHILLEQARKGSFVAACYLSKARCGWIEGAPPPDSRPNIIIQLPQSKTEAEYLETMARAAAAGPLDLAPKGIALPAPPVDPNAPVVYTSED
jgi:hypothetical protein